jgi:hypothetical protein
MGLAALLVGCGQPAAGPPISASPRLTTATRTPSPTPTPTPTPAPSPPNLPAAGGIGVPGGFAAYVYARGLGTTTAMAFGPDGRLYVVNSGGAVLVVPSPGASPHLLVSGLPIAALGLAWRDNRLFVSVRGSVRDYQLNNGTLSGGGAVASTATGATPAWLFVALGIPTDWRCSRPPAMPILRSTARTICRASRLTTCCG